MKIKQILKNKYFWITISILIVSGLAVLYFVFFNKTLKSPTDGIAAFYEYPSESIDSILETFTDEEKTAILIFAGNINNNNNDFSSIKQNYSGAFYLEYNTDTCLDMFSTNPKSSRFINAISENILTKFSNDSLMFAAPLLINTISDYEIFKKYFNYQIEILKLYNINGLVLNYTVPEISDSTSMSFQTNKTTRKLGLLHEQNILSIIEITEIPEFKNDETKQLFYSSIQEIADSGLCAILFNRSSDLNLLNEIEFDGLIIYNITNFETPSDDIISKVDIFINNSQSLDKNVINEFIKKACDKKTLFLKDSKVIRAGLWANNITQPQETTDSTSKSLNLKLLESNLTEKSITIIKNSGNLVPLTNIHQKIHIVFAAKDKTGSFLKAISKYSEDYTLSYYNFETDLTPSTPNSANTMVILYENQNSADSIPKGIRELLDNYKNNKIFINYGNLPADLANINSDCIIQVYNNNESAFSFSGQLIFGGIKASGKLSTYINDSLKSGFGVPTNKTRLKYSMPEDVGLNSDTLKNIDSIINNAIANGVMPGCQVFIAKNGVVVYDKSFGYHDYSRSINVKGSDMYDIASLTKICGTTLAMMKMVETGKINLNSKLEEYFDDTEIDYSNIEPDTLTFIDTVSIAGKTTLEIIELVTNKDTIHLNDTLVELTEIVISRATPDLNIFKVPVRSLMVHQSGINPSLPILPYMFYEKTYEELLRKQRDDADTIEIAITDSISIPKDTSIIFTHEEAYNCFYSNRWLEDSAEIKIADNMYFKQRWFDSLYTDVKRLGVYSSNIYQYTDMNMILAQMTIDSVNDKPIDEFLKQEFYYYLGLNNTTYKPLNYFPRYRITPTERETFWRKQTIRGNVHDPSAAMLGGVSGNAGLFSSASDLGIIGQMWLNGGSYGGIRYLNPGTINMFASTQPENHRGLGFDKAGPKNLNAKDAPASSYGHTGFTGCVMWMDPENDIVYVFLSNRLHPDVNNWRILSYKVLQNVHQVVYDAMEE